MMKRFLGLIWFLVNSTLRVSLLFYSDISYYSNKTRLDTVPRHYKIFCVNGNTGFRNESRIFNFIHLQNEEEHERKESSSA